jgi:hypothetical protein
MPDKNKDKELSDQIAAAQIRLAKKLTSLDLTSLRISEYNQNYLGFKIKNIRPILQLYGRLLYLSLERSLVPTENFILVDYGGGSGLISLLGAEIGIGTIVYNDIYDVSCADVRCLSGALGLGLDHIVSGDVDELVSYLHENSISIDAIISYDVLEHIYDVQSHFQRLSTLCKSQFRVVYGSGANMANPRYVYSVRKKQIEAEYKNREKAWGHKERDSLKAYCDVRKEMISTYAPDLGSEQVEQLTRSTRGLIKRDIEKCVDDFRRKGSIDYRPNHPTNTCDPYTGNWCEHLIDLGWLEEVIRNEGFSVEIRAGFYNMSGGLVERFVRKTLNGVIQFFGRRSMFIAPYYMVYAEFLPEQNSRRN